MWTIANAIGLAAGWTFGEAIGQLVAKAFGWHIGLVAAAILFESVLWFGRLFVTTRFKEFDTLTAIDRIVWLTTEVFGWIVTEAFYSPGQPLTFGAVYVTTLGAGLWVTMASTRLAGRNGASRSLWWIRAFAFTLFGFLAGSILIALIVVFSMEVENIVQTFSPFVGWSLSGAILGACIGALTGLALIKLMSWSASRGPQAAP